jgi:predicted signal transduction protein with EAL and GGDEF domain
MIGTSTDISDRHVANSALYRIVEKAQTEVYVFHPRSLNFEQVNEGARRNLRFGTDELPGMTPVDLMPDYDPHTLRFFDPGMQAEVAARAALAVNLRRALAQGEFVLDYQMQVDGEGRVTGAEGLLRWQHPQRGLLEPAAFIRLAEETATIVPLGRWVLDMACAQLAAWSERPETKDLMLAVNISAHQFHNPDFVDQVLDAVDHGGCDPTRLKLEITEGLLIDDCDGIIAKMSALQERGITFALEDFGTGFPR